MPVQIVRNDITKMPVDAIVNAANNRLANGGGVTGAIHKAAGPRLLEECMTLGGCKTGEAKITGGYLLPCRYVIHTVGPVWRGGLLGEKAQLASCYHNSLRLALQYHCSSVAFPLISSGIFGYPKEQALKVAMDAISEFLLSHDCDLTVYLVVFTKDSVKIGQKLFHSITQYIDDHYVDTHVDSRRESQRVRQLEESLSTDWNAAWNTETPSSFPMQAPAPKAAAFRTEHGEATALPLSLEDALEQIDESFSQMVLRKIKEKGIKNSECYKKANVDKKLFSKIAGDIHYTPKKTTAVALAIALELSLPEARELLSKAGYALSKSSRFDIIIEYCLLHHIYNIHEVNIILYDFDQTLLGV